MQVEFAPHVKAIIDGAMRDRHPQSKRNAKMTPIGSLELRWTTSDKDEFLRVLAVIKLIPGREFDVKRKIWNVPATPDNASLLHSAGFSVEQSVQTALSIEVDDSPAPWLEMRVNRKLLHPDVRKYQLDFIRAMKFWGGRGLNCDEMGTGKTCQALSWARYIECERTLVVTTASTKRQWGREFKKWKGPGRVVELSGRKPMHLDSRVACFVINWDVLADWAPALAKHKFDLIIGDEVHMIGNPEARRTKAFQKLARAFPNMIALTGTPIRTRPAQFWTILNLVAPTIFPDYKKYLNRYCDPKPNFMGKMDHKGASNVQELHAKVKNLMIRRLKHEVLTELPEKIRSVVPIQVSKEYFEAEELALAHIDGSRDAIRKAMENLSASVFPMKAEGVMKWVAEFLQEDRKLIIFAWHTAVVEYLMQELGKSAVKVNGSSSPKDRDEAIKAFQTKPSVRVFIGNILAAGVGIDGLQKVCSDVAFVELGWSPSDMNQAEDRLHRFGQENPVSIHYLLGEDTIEEDHLEILQKRWGAIGKILDGEESALDIHEELVQLRKNRKNGKARED